jgi:fucose permease
MADEGMRPAHAGWAIAFSYAAMMVLAIAVNLLPVFLTTLSSDFGGATGLTNEQLGRVGGLTFVGLVAGVALTGPLADRLGPRWFAVGGNLLIGLGLLLLHRAPGYGAVLASATVMGFGAGVLDMVLSPIVAALQPHRRTAAMNWLHSFYCIGAVATILVATAALRWAVTWRTLALWLAPTALAVGLAFCWLRLPAMVQHGAERTRLRVLVRDGGFLLALVAIFLAGATELGLAQWLPAYAEYTLHYSTTTGGIALLVFSVLMAVGRIGVGMLGHRVTPQQTMQVCCWGSTVLFVAACFAPAPAVALAACMAVGLTGSCLWPTMLGVTADRYPHGGASMFGLLATLGNFGGVFMPWMVGVVADATSLRWGLATSLLCPLIMALLLLKLQRLPPAKA